MSTLDSARVFPLGSAVGQDFFTVAISMHYFGVNNQTELK